MNSILKRVEEDLENGADIIDIGGESTRPGSEPVSLEEQIRRIEKPISEIKRRFDVPVSIDTTRYDVAKIAVENGADIINDTSGFTEDPEKMELVRQFRLGMIIMHRLATPKTMQQEIHYDNCVREVTEFLQKQAEKAVNYGIDSSSILLDPGIGFGKLINHNLELLNNSPALQATGYPVVIGLSRKSFLGQLLNNEAKDRLTGTIAATTLSLTKGADALRVHDVKETFEAVKVWQAFQNNNFPNEKRLASIDIGSNTCRLLIGTVENGHINTIFETQKIIRISEKIVNSSVICDAAIERVVNLLNCYSRYFKKYGVTDYFVTATSAMREAENSDEIVKKVKEQSGLNINVISEQKEAELAVLGVMSGLSDELKQKETKIIVDIGGGSTEYTLVTRENGSDVITNTISLSLGVVKLKDLYVQNDPPTDAEMNAVRKHVQKGLEQIQFPPINPENTVFAGTAGTITTLAAVKLNMKWYDGERINNTEMDSNEITDILNRFLGMTNPERAALPQLEKGREDLIIPGIILLQESMSHFGINKLVVVDYGLREGSLLNLATKITE